MENIKNIRERLNPIPGDYYYLHLTDLLQALKKVSSVESLTILDFGSGDSPYRELFPNSDYRRADIASELGATIDYLIKPDGTVDERSQTFDLILSTQVLEHVPMPEKYLSECFRLLKPGGRLVCTTHGSFPDHDCPSDYFRWTHDGLCLAITNAGFFISASAKLTCGTRALFSLFELGNYSFDTEKTSLMSLFLLLVRKIYWHSRPMIHRRLDDRYGHESVVVENLERFAVYLGLMIVGIKNQDHPANS